MPTFGKYMVLACGMLALALPAHGRAPQPKPSPQKPKKMAAGKYAHFVTSKGTIVVELLPQSAPKTVDNFVRLAQGKKQWTDPKTRASTVRPLYNGTVFHRVLPNFMIQGGDPLGNGTGGPGYRFEDEFDPNVKFDKSGILAMANSGPNTNGSQFFITVAPTPWLQGKHSIFGRVVKGQEVADAISLVSTGQANRPREPITLEKVLIQDMP